MQKQEFRELIKIYCSFGIEICWEDLLKIPNSIVKLIIKYKNRKVVSLVTTILKQQAKINEDYLASAINFIITKNIDDMMVLEALKEQRISIDKVEYILLTDNNYIRCIIKSILLNQKLCDLGIDIECIDEILKVSDEYLVNLIYNFMIDPNILDSNMLFEGVRLISASKSANEALAISQVLSDPLGIESGLNIEYATKISESEPEGFESIMQIYRKAISKFLCLKREIHSTGIMEVRTKLNGLSGEEEITRDDIIRALYHSKGSSTTIKQ